MKAESIKTTPGAKMHYLIIDLTHGGVKIAITLAKKGKTVKAHDIYKTLNDIDAEMLGIYGVELVQLEDLAELKGRICVISPIHLPLTQEEIEAFNPNLDYNFMTHHQAIGEILKGWGADIPKLKLQELKEKQVPFLCLRKS